MDLAAPCRADEETVDTPREITHGVLDKLLTLNQLLAALRAFHHQTPFSARPRPPRDDRSTTPESVDVLSAVCPQEEHSSPPQKAAQFGQFSGMS
jgi:hypothetical protein